MSTQLYYLLVRQRRAEVADRAERVRQMRDGRRLDATRGDRHLLDRVMTALRRGDAARSRVHPPNDPSPGIGPLAAAVGITLRLADADDSPAIAELAGLDSASVPSIPVLIAEADGELRAALSLHDGAIVADPFHRTLVAQQLLRARAAQLRGDPVRDVSRPFLGRVEAAARPRHEHERGAGTRLGGHGVERA